MTSRVMLQGVIPPIITPVDEDDRVDEAAFRAQIRRLIDAGVHGLFVGGTCGEGPLLTTAEWQRMMTIARDACPTSHPLLGGVSDSSTKRVLEKIAVLRNLGYDCLVVTPTFYIPGRSPAEQRRLFDACVAHAGSMETVVYNLPQAVGCRADVDVVIEFAARGQVRYCKESSGDLDYCLHLIERGRDVDLGVLIGDEAALAGALLGGARGAVPACANVIPEVFLRAYTAAKAGDMAGLASAHVEIMHVRDVVPLGSANWLAGIKTAVSILGIGNGRVVSPLEQAGPAQRERMEALLSGR